MIRWRLARIVSVPPSTLSRWLNAAETPKTTDPRVLAIAAVIGVPPGRIFEAENHSAVDQHSSAW